MYISILLSYLLYALMVAGSGISEEEAPTLLTRRKIKTDDTPEQYFALGCRHFTVKNMKEVKKCKTEKSDYCGAVTKCHAKPFWCQNHDSKTYKVLGIVMGPPNKKRCIKVRKHRDAIVEKWRSEHAGLVQIIEGRDAKISTADAPTLPDA